MRKEFQSKAKFIFIPIPTKFPENVYEKQAYLITLAGKKAEFVSRGDAQPGAAPGRK